jgi:Pre-mRNA 3'-end-processing endonuclease polyadenylation factor C-term
MTDETQSKAIPIKEDLSNYVTIDGIFIKQDFEHLIVGEDDVDEYTQLTKSTMKQTLFVPFTYDVQVLNFYIHSYFAEVRIEYGNKEFVE